MVSKNSAEVCLVFLSLRKAVMSPSGSEYSKVAFRHESSTVGCKFNVNQSYILNKVSLAQTPVKYGIVLLSW